MDPVKRTYWRTVALVALVFASGMAAGVLATKAVVQRRVRELVTGDPAAMRRRLMMHALEQRLDLTTAQRDEAERVLRAQDAPFLKAIEPCRPQVRELRRGMARDLAPVLEPDQRAILDDLIQMRETEQ
jgi:hypothetical protein